MKKLLTATLCSLLVSGTAMAQTKVFKEVSEGMTSTMELIMQNDQLVGYLRFTQLEKASKDSFNYRIEIMDENLNDIGTVNFRDEQINLQSVAFEQDVLCLAYLKSNIIGTEFKNKRSYKRSLDEADNYVYTQFITLEGKILKTNEYKVSIELDKNAFANQVHGQYVYVFTKYVGYGDLEHPMQLANIPGVGFACFYGDAVNNHLITYTAQGQERWHKEVAEEALGYTLHTSGNNIYLLAKKDHRMEEGGFELKGFNADGTAYEKTVLKDEKGNQLKVISIANDPATGKAYLTGNILNSDRNSSNYNAKKLVGRYKGVFSMNLDGAEADMTYSYWNDGSQMPAISERGYNYRDKAYPLYSRSFKDFDGNTYFAGPSFNKKTRWGNITASVILSPLIVVSPYLLYALGTQKSSIRETAILKQDEEGKITMERSIPGNKGKYYVSKMPLSYYNNRRLYHVVNNDTRTNYLVVNDDKDVSIYNVEQKKVARVIPHYKGSVYYNVMPAKEGHVLVTQYDAKARSTRYSIEAL